MKYIVRKVFLRFYFNYLWGRLQPTDYNHFLCVRWACQCKKILQNFMLIGWGVLVCQVPENIARFHRKVWSSLARCLAPPRLHVMRMDASMIILARLIVCWRTCVNMAWHKWHVEQLVRAVTTLTGANERLAPQRMLDISVLALTIRNYNTINDVR
jgi:hypothetical protein